VAATEPDWPVEPALTVTGKRAGVARDRPAHPGRGLEVAALRVQYGGVVAVRDLTLTGLPGQITGLIGPNGAGKSTTFNACSGLIKPVSGRIKLHGVDVSRKSTATRARLGLGRTFQRMQLFESLTTEENVALGREAAMAAGGLLSQLIARSGEKPAITRATREALDLCGIASLHATQVSTLSTGQRRLVELARCLAGPFDLLLLDEPSSGLDRGETERFGAVLQRVVRERGVGIVLVEHDMSLVTEICQHIYVLDFGELIFEGTPEEMADSAIVRAAYLGTEELADQAIELP
jgi:ABC-type branched-subunit amino acid transport system ATPase component